MTDQAPQAPAATTAPATPGSMENALNATLNAAPELGKSPGLAVGVASSGGNTEVRAQAIARGAQTVSDQRAHNDVSASNGDDISDALNWFGNHVLHPVADVGHEVLQGAATAGKQVLNTSNKYLQVVQHEYRYLHDVEATHGRGAAVLEGIGVALGAAGGFALGGVPAAVMGAEAATGLESQMFYRSSWARTAKASYEDPHTHQQVSFGRDVISELSHVIPELRRGTTAFKITSGLIDGIADMQVGGGEIGGLVGEARSAEGASGLLGHLFGGTNPIDAEDLDRVYAQYGSVRRAFADIARKSAGEIAATPAYQGIARQSDLLRQLGNANSADEVAQTFKDVFRTHELAFMDKMPTLSITRVPFQALRESAENAGGIVGRVARGVTRLPDSYDDAAKVFTGREFDPSDPLDDGTVGIYRMARFTEDRTTAASLATEYANTPDLATKLRIYRKLQLSTLFNLAGLRGMSRDAYLASFRDPEVQRAMSQALDDALSGHMFGKGAVYGLDDEGRVISLIRDLHSSWQYGAGITMNQTGKLQFLDLSQARRAARAIANARDDTGAIASAVNRARYRLAGTDDFFYNTVTQGIFKPLVLLTPSYALHIALAELIPNALRLGVHNLVSSAVAINMARLGIRAGDLPGDLSDARLFPTALGDVRFLKSTPVDFSRLQPLMDAANKTTDAVQGIAWKLAGGKHFAGQILAAARREAGSRASDEEVERVITDWMNGARGAPAGLDGFAKRLGLAARYVEYNDGHLVSPALSSGHNYASEVSREESTRSLLRRYVFDSPKRTSKTFGVFGVGHEQYVAAWQAWLHELSNDGASRVAARTLLDSARRGASLDDATKDAETALAGRLDRDGIDGFLRTMTDEQRSRMLRSMDGFTSYGLPGTPAEGLERPPDMDGVDEWAKVIVANLKGATRGADRSMNVPLLDRIANGEWTSDDELEAIENTKRPINVKGRELVPDGTSSVQRLADVGFRRVLNPMVNFLSRQPIAFAEFEKQWAIEEPKIASGFEDEDEAMVNAMRHTVQNVIRNVHNIHDRTQWTVTMRNWLPFYFAQEQAYRRMGRLLAENPGAFRKYQLMITNLHDVGQIFGGQNGDGYFVMPGTGFMTTGAVQAAARIGLPVESSSPVGMGWNLSASSVIFPLSAGFRPDIGPLLAVPTQAIAELFPETLSPVLKSDLTAAANTVLGPDSTESIYEQMIPNTIVQRLMQATFPAFNERSFDSTMMQTLASLDAEGQVPPPTASAWQMQGFLDKVRNQTRIMYAVKALVGAVTPVSPELTDQMYDKNNTELSNDIDQASSVAKGIEQYLSEHPDATPFTVFQSTDQQGVTVPSSVAAENWINDNLALIRKYPSAALLLMPPNENTTYNAAVYNEQIAQGLRTKWFPGDVEPNGELAGYLAQLYVAAGNSVVLDKWYPQYEKQLAGLSGQQKYDAETAWDQTLTDYGAKNPIWYQWWQADGREIERGQAINQMRSLLASPEAPRTEIATQARTLLKAYDNYEAQMQAGSLDGYAIQSESSVEDNWKNDLYATVEAHPEVTNLVSGLFLSLPTTEHSTGAPEGAPGQFTASSWRSAA